MEVDTPVLSAAATVDPAIESLRGDDDRWLHTSPEFAMKRLLAAGTGPIYQLGHVFRSEECGRFHEPEFTLLEWYRPGWQMSKLMEEVEALLHAVGAPAPRYERITYRDAFRRHAGFDPARTTVQQVRTQLAAAGIDLATVTDAEDLDLWLDLAMSHRVAPQLGEQAPCFVYEYPASQAALARVDATVDPPVALRFEVFWRGIELANGFQELTDGAEQRRRFERDVSRRRAAGQRVPPVDEALLDAIDYGLPDSAGVALGLDRVLMLLLGLPCVADTLSFDAARA